VGFEAHRASELDEILPQVRAELGPAITRDPRELDSLLTLLGSQLSISLSMLD